MEIPEQTRVAWERGIQPALHLVSRRWNAIARDTPAIDRFILITVPGGTSVRETVIAALFRHTKNSDGLEIKVHIPQPRFAFRYLVPTVDIQGLLPPLVLNLDRCRVLDIDLGRDTKAGVVVLEGLIKPAPTLEELKLSCSFEIAGRPLVQPEMLFDIFSGITPRLKSVELTGLYTPWDRPIFHHLEVLSVDTLLHPMQPTFDDLQHLERGSPNLRGLRLSCSEFVSGLHPKTICFPKLETFIIKCPASSMSNIFSHISTPSLTGLNISLIHDSPSADISGRRPFCTLIGVAPFELPMLQSLAFGNHPLTSIIHYIDRQDYVDMLHRLSALRYLTLFWASPKLIHAMSVPSNMICPRLTHLHLSLSDEILPEMLMQFIEGRAPEAVAGGEPSFAVLRRLEIEWCEHFEPDMPFAQWARDKGVEVEIRSRPPKVFISRFGSSTEI